MNKNEFLKKLDYYLLAINDNERDRFLNYYEEMIEDYIENGLSEEEAIDKIGNPKLLTKKILEENVEISSTYFHDNSIFKLFFMIIMFPIYGPLLLIYYILLAMIPLTILFSEIAIGAVAIVSILGCPFVAVRYNISVGIMQMGVGIICIGIFLLLYQALVTCLVRVSLLLKKTNKKIIFVLKGGKYEKK